MPPLVATLLLLPLLQAGSTKGHAGLGLGGARRTAAAAVSAPAVLLFDALALQLPAALAASRNHAFIGYSERKAAGEVVCRRSVRTCLQWLALAVLLPGLTPACRAFCRLNKEEHGLQGYDPDRLRRGECRGRAARHVRCAARSAVRRRHTTSTSST